MEMFMTRVKNYLVSEDGPTAIEYTVMLATIVLVWIGTLTKV